MIENKNTHSLKEQLGQFFTPVSLATDLLDKTYIDTDVIIEPSFGDGSSFLTLLHNKYPDKTIIGLELDEKCFTKAPELNNCTLFNQNFYDWLPSFTQDVTFVGNPPYRSPAMSLSTHKKHIQMLMKTYDVKGVREEAIFFILHTLYILDMNNINGKVHYIVPSSIIKNSVKDYNTFKRSFLSKCHVSQITTVKGTTFDNVSQDLIYISFETTDDKRIQDTILVDGVSQPTDEYFCIKDVHIPFQKIFTKTYLGSVPCESVLMSVSGESKQQFQKRLSLLIHTNDPTDDELFNGLTFNDKAHLSILTKSVSDGGFLPKAQDKLIQIRDYLKQMRTIQDLGIFDDISNYKPIQCRKEVKYYFRHTLLKRMSFVYEINPNPCVSFYLTGNPSSSSTDYFGFCEYDVNRNSSPGACRTVPIDTTCSHITPEFRTYWSENTDHPVEYVYDYIIHISKTDWYKQMKKNNKRFYFGVPIEFDKTFQPEHPPSMFEI